MRFLFPIFFSTTLLISTISCSALPGIFNQAVMKDGGQALEESYQAIVDKPNRKEHLEQVADHMADVGVEAAEGAAGLPALDPDLNLFNDGKKAN